MFKLVFFFLPLIITREEQTRISPLDYYFLFLFKCSVFLGGLSKNIKMNEAPKRNVILGVILLPVMTVLFLLDRIILTFLVWINSNPIQTWLQDSQMIANSTIRIATAAIAISLTFLFKNLLS